ncbi:MAG: right-handed parallel beta-helix repeat-containing protein, partial [Desulfobacterales bacterium]|nr:right-handed parallel beta-helix repeat-containing protein [Desulfobacterales bacterium]
MAHMKRLSVLVLVLILLGSLWLTHSIQPTKASGTIYIRADGSIDPPDAPVSTVDHVTYTLTGNINSEADGIVVERNNITIDGDGYTVQGSGVSDSKGIDLTGRSNVTIRNMRITAFHYGIDLRSSSGNIISRNNLLTNLRDAIALGYSSNNNNILENNIDAGNNAAIEIYSSSNNNTISSNNIENAAGGIYVGDYCTSNMISRNNLTAGGYKSYGIRLSSTSSNTISENNVANNLYGIYLYGSSNNTLRGNKMTNNSYNFAVSGNSLLDYVNNVDTSNIVDGKPIYYWVNVQDMAVPLDAGQVILVNSTHILVQNLNLTKNTEGILLAFTTNTSIIHNTIVKNSWGIHL